MVVDQQTQKVIFRVFKESKVRLHNKIKILTDTGYQDLQKLHINTQIPKEKIRKKPLTPQEKAENKQLSSRRVINENVIGVLKQAL